MKLSTLFQDRARRQHLIQALFRSGAALLLCSVILGILIYAAVTEPPRSVQLQSSPSVIPPSTDRLKLPSGLCLIPAEEDPLALTVYDGIFAAPDGITTEGELRIAATDLSQSPSLGEVLIKNTSGYSLNVYDFLTATEPSLPVSASPADPDEPPLVLIYHSHGTESYAAEGYASYPSSGSPRSEDTEKNVVAVGRVLAETLNAYGIPTLHCEIMHDSGGQYNHAYENSRKTLQSYLEQYPSIRYAFDLHRDALMNETVAYKTVTYDESKPLAQLMFVVGTDSGGASHPDWRRSFSFAVNAQHLLTCRQSNLMRPLSLRGSAFNQQYPEIGLLIEVGTCVNTLAEAKASARVLGEILAGMIVREAISPAVPS